MNAAQKKQCYNQQDKHLPEVGCHGNHDFLLYHLASSNNIIT